MSQSCAWIGFINGLYRLDWIGSHFEEPVWIGLDWIGSEARKSFLNS